MIRNVGQTQAYGNVESFAIWASVGDLAPDDGEWAAYVKWLGQLIDEFGSVEVLVLAGTRAPTYAQRGLITRELDAEKTRFALLLSDTRMLPLAKVFGWFVKNTRILGENQIQDGLAYLGHPMSSEVGALLEALRPGQRANLP